MPKVSVIIASYNHEAYVRAALQSVLDQSYQDFEIVVTDDGSTDRTAQSIREVRDRRVQLEVFASNRGACVAMNECIRRSKGAYIAVLNSDDLSLPGRLDRQVAYLDANPGVGAVFGRPVFIDANGSPLPAGKTFYGNTFDVDYAHREQWLRHIFFRGNALCHPSLLIRKRCYDDVGTYNPALAQLPDMEMWVRLLGKHEIHVMREPLVALRILPNEMNASAPRPATAVRVQWELAKVLRRYLTLEPALLAKAFPEIADRPGTVRDVPWQARTARRLLERFIDGPGEHSPTIKRADKETAPPWAWSIGKLALGVDQPGHVVFGLDAMYESLPQMQGEDRYREFIASVGAYDPFGVLFGLPTNRNIAAIERTHRMVPASDRA